MSTLANLILAGFLIAGCSPAAPATHTVTGLISFPGYVHVASPECTGDKYWGSADLQTGMQVVVVDEAEKTIGTGRLSNTPASAAASTDAAGLTHLSSTSICFGEFSIEQVPDANFYQVRLGVRKSEQYAKADLEARGWKVGLSIQAQ